MLKAYKYRIFPNDVQQTQLDNIFGQVRFVYNLGLETKISAYLGSKSNLNYFSLANQLKELKDSLAGIINNRKVIVHEITKKE
jgi:putative transposase